MPRIASLKYQSYTRNIRYPAVNLTILTASPVPGNNTDTTSTFLLVWRNLPVGTEITFLSLNPDLASSPEPYNIGPLISGSVTRTYTIKADNIINTGPKSFRIQALINGVVYNTSNQIFVQDAAPTYSISHGVLTINEGITVLFTFTITNTFDGTVFYWTNVGSSTASDFIQNVNHGSFAVYNNTASIFLTPRQDLITEGTETIIIQLRSDSITGNVLATSGTVNIIDTSSNPISITAITPSSYAGASGQSFTITGTQFSNVAIVYFRTVDDVDYVLTTTFVNSSTLTAVTTRNFLVAEAPLTVRVVQGFSEAQFADAVTCGSSPTWITTAGNIGPTLYDKTFNRSFSANVLAVDPDGGNITYSFVGTGYPVNTILNSSTGAITNSSIARVATTTLYSFIVRATDPIGNFTDRQFSISVIAPTVVIYSYTGGDQTFTVPAGIQYVEFKLWGAGGTATQSLTFAPIPVGGDGGFAQSTIPTTAGTTYTLIVGQSTYNRNGGLNYGGGRSGSYDGSYGGGDGGGRSAVRLGGTEILTAGGGGGGGMYWMTGPQPWASPGGVGGGLVGGGGGGYAWTAAGDGRTAGGGTQTAGGLGARHQGPPPNTGNANDFTVRFAPGNGSQFAGGPVASSYAGGGGGGGWYGGGGGTGEKLQDSGTRWGGGGGSGWAGRNGASTLPGTNYGSVESPEDVNGRTDTVTNITYYYTVVIQGRNSGDVHYGNNAGLGINVYNTPSAVGGHGRIVVIY